MISDEALKKHILSYSCEKANNMTPQPKCEDIRVIWSREEERKSNIITENEKRFLLDILDNPFSGVVERYRRLGLNPYQGNKLSKKLKAKKLIQYEEIKTFRGRLKIIRLTRSAEKLLAVKSSFNSTGSFEHEFWKHKIACHLKNKGFKVIPEYSLPDGGKTDILAIKNSKTFR